LERERSLLRHERKAMEREERLFHRDASVLSTLLLELCLGFLEQLGDEEVGRAKEVASGTVEGLLHKLSPRYLSALGSVLGVRV
jgi:hypothetical protein